MWDIFFHLEEGPASLRPCRISEVGQPRRGTSGFSVPLHHRPYFWLPWTFSKGFLALLFRPSPITQHPLGLDRAKGHSGLVASSSMLPLKWDPSPTSGQHLITCCQGSEAA